MKSEHIKTHELAVLSHLMAESLDDIEQMAGGLSPEALNLKQKCREITPMVEKILTELYQVDQIHSTTYLTDLANKVHTVLRKNYKQIPA